MIKIYRHLNTNTLYAENDGLWYIWTVNHEWEPTTSKPTENLKYLSPVTWGRLYENFERAAA